MVSSGVVVIENVVFSSVDVSVLLAVVVICVDVLKCVVEEHGTKTQHKILIS